MNQYFISSKNGKLNVIEGIKINDPLAIILNVHGLGSHFQKVYDNLDDFINRDKWFSKFNYQSIAFEFHGHGKSDGTRCLINNYCDLICDLEIILQFISNKYLNKPIIICAESLGGAVVISYVFNKKIDLIKGIILLSPLCGIDKHFKPNKVILNVLYYTSYLFPKLKLAFTTKKMASESAQNIDYLNARGVCCYSYKGAHRLGTVREILKICNYIQDNNETFNYPLLLFHGINDKITTPGDSVVFFNTIKSLDKELVLLDGSEHNLLIENNFEDLKPNFILAKITNWINNLSLEI